MTVLNRAAADDLAQRIADRLTDGYLEILGADASVLVRLRLPMAAFVPNPVGGQMLSGLWYGSVRQSGTATAFRLVSRDGAWSMAGPVSASGNGLNLDRVALVFGEMIDITACGIVFP